MKSSKHTDKAKSVMAPEKVASNSEQFLLGFPNSPVCFQTLGKVTIYN